MPKKPGLTYRDAGVDIDAGNAVVDRIKPLVKATFRPEVLTEIGGFGGLFSLGRGRYQDPVLVSGTDGVGTKLALAQRLGQHDTIGIDLVAMCVNDIIVQGAEPLFFLDYFSTGHLEPDVVVDVVSGIADGCRQSGCALIGGETAEMPDMYPPGEYDLAGFAVGIVERNELLDGSGARAGDLLIGIASSGPHSNGYSLIRRILELADADLESAFEGNRTLGDVLLEPTRIYVSSAQALARETSLRGLAHITGGGLTENVVRSIPASLGAEIDQGAWTRPAIFDWLAEHGDVAPEEMLRTFNCGIGMVAIVPESDADTAVSICERLGHPAGVIGRVVADTEHRARFL
ncbi:MAG: phosphoribosylformylglycinamidine cyclo-ligase [Xanthomonadales bacterium]|nr:phosphoribosylformylglycinamidine cyclo-ligase [Xanthomonadales bacterium]